MKRVNQVCIKHFATLGTDLHFIHFTFV